MNEIMDMYKLVLGAKLKQRCSNDRLWPQFTIDLQLGRKPRLPTRM